MNRRQFIGFLAGVTMVTGAGVSLSHLMGKEDTGRRLPVLFLGHGSPMNAIADNQFTRTLGLLGKKIPRPEAILCVSAHWMTEGSWITHMDRPKTIHDFYGFPKPLFDIQYPAPGNPALAKFIQSQITDPKINLDHEMWGLDHGTWAVLKHMYPEADIPVMQLSLHIEQPPAYHFKLGQELAKLRDKGILIVSSGNIVHNLRAIKWEDNASPYPWAIEFDEWVKTKLLNREFNSLQNDFLKTEAGRLSVPTPDHWYPFLYTLGAALKDDVMRLEYEEIQNGSISMRCVSFGMVS
jgi:4,5-DOPA dioxygenase extradiol